jgi:hypothetical protein
VKDHEPEDIDHLVFTQCKKLMEASRLFRLSIGSQKKSSIFLWRLSSFWNVAHGSVRYQMLYCPMKCRFNCYCQLEICRTDLYVSVEMRGTHDENSHAPDNDVSKILKVAQIEAIMDGVQVAPSRVQSIFVAI